MSEHEKTPIPDAFKLAMIENCQECPIRKQMEEVVKVLAERKGEKAVWSKVSTVATAIVGILLAAFLNYKFAQFRQLQEDVAKRLKESQDSHALILERSQKH